MKKNIKQIIMIPPSEMKNKKYIYDKILEKKNTCINEGYIKEIIQILDISFHKFYEQNFSGNILITVEFEADVIDVEIDDIIQCKIVKADVDGIIAEAVYPIYTMVKDYEKLDFLKEDDIIKVKILKKQIGIKNNIIKTVSSFIEKVEMEQQLNNSE